MSPNLKNRFIEIYTKVYGIIPSLLWDGIYYRSPHLPMAMSSRRFQAHIARLELRVAE